MKLINQITPVQISGVRIKKKIKFALFRIIAGFNNHHLKNEKIRLHEINKILIIRQDNRIGNLLFITSLIELIRQQTAICPDIIVGEKYHSLLTNNQSIGKVHVFRQKAFTKRPWLYFKFISNLKSIDYDLVIDCKSSFSFTNAALILFSNAKQKIGFSNSLSEAYLNYSLELKNNDSMHESIYLTQPFLHYFKLTCEVPAMIYTLASTENNKVSDFDSIIVGIHIGGRNEKSICLNLVNHICAELQNTNTHILIIYGPDEIEKIRLINDGQNIIKIFPASLEQLAQSINSTDIFITPDTGPLHIASALNKRIIAIFNTKNWNRYGPRSQQPSLTIHTKNLSSRRIVNMIKLSSSLPNSPQLKAENV